MTMASCAAQSAAAAPFDLAIKRSDVDLAACKTFQNGTPADANSDQVLCALGLLEVSPDRDKGWSAGSTSDNRKLNFAYTIVFKKPVAAGSIFMRGDVSDLAYLPGDAKEVPKAPDDPAWKSLAKGASQQGAATYPLAAGQQIRALRVTDSRSWGESKLFSLRLLKSRYQNITPAALAYASREYYRQPADFSSAFLFEASLVTKGTGVWYSAGLNLKQVINTPVISDVSPEWFLLAWNEPQTISGLWLDTSMDIWQLESFAGPESVNPRAGVDNEWKNIREPVVTKRQGLWIEFPKPVVTRGLRFTTTKVTGPPQIASIAGYHTFVDLADKPPVEIASSEGKREKAPFNIPYALADEGFMTMVVKDPQGRTVRNMFARRYSDPGKAAEPWDLKDEAGYFIKPGEYKWLALYHPRLQPKYEFTVYPNVRMNNPENPPWITSMNGSGGWMADHTPPSTVCTSGDRAYLGSRVAESGVSLIETDSRGKKLWAHHSFAAWTGPENLAADDKKVYVGATVLGEVPDNIWTVDIASKEVKQLCRMEPTTSRRRGMKGLAVRDGKLYVSVNASMDYLAGAASAEDVDILSCHPIYPVPRRKKNTGDIPADPRRDFLGLFRMNQHPPGHNVPGSLVYLETDKGTSQRQHVVLAFNRKVPIGSLCFPMPEEKDVRLQVSALREDGTYPPLAGDESQWKKIPLAAAKFWSVVPMPEGLETRALRLTFVRGDEEDAILAGGDNIDEAIDGPSIDRDGPETQVVDSFGKSHDEWVGRLEGMKLMRRRFKNLADTAKVRVNSGKVARNGVWDAQRDRAVTEADPGIYALEWDAPQSLRGLAIREIDGQITKIDVYEGPASGEIDIAATKGWKEMTSYEQQRRDVGNGFGLGLFNGKARYVDGYIDFGGEIKTRAVRLRVVKQWADKGQAGCMGIREDLGGGELDPRRCRVFGVAAVQYLGGEAATDPLTYERIETYTADTGKLEDETPLAKPGRLAIDPKGRLHAISGKQIVRIESGKAVPVVTDLENPTDVCIDAKGAIYAFDAGAKRSNVRVYDAAGKFQRTIGKPGGFVVGAWDPERMGQVVDIDVDGKDQLWVVETQYFPKRITQWTTAGKFLREHLGNTNYGGAGVLDPWDKRRVYYHPLEFELDWKTGESRLKNMMWLGTTPAGEVPVRIGKIQYMVNRPAQWQNSVGVVYIYDKDHLKMAAAVGQADGFDPLKASELVVKADKSLGTLNFIWGDTNGNGEVDADEVQFSDRPKSMGNLSIFNRDLSLQAGTVRWEVKEFLPNGVPVFEQLDFPKIDGHGVKRLSDGNFFIMGENDKPERVVTPEGETVWTYPSTGSGGHALYRSTGFRADECVSEMIFAGHEPPNKDGIGEVLAFHTNAGQWTLWTGDGLFFGPFFRDHREPGAVPWSMQQHDRGMELTDVTVGVEHFQGYFCRSMEDGKYYAVAGHNHISIVELLGMDKVKRMSGKLTVTEADVSKAQQFEQKHEAAKGYARAPVIDCYRLTEPPQLDGVLTDWPEVSATIDKQARLHIGFNDEFLFVGYAIEGMGPFKNTGTQWDRLFKTGASVDLQIGVDPEAPLDREECVAGDQRLLMTFMQDKPIAVTYRPVSPEASASDKWEVVSPVSRATFDEVRQAAGVQIVAFRGKDGNSYTVEAAIPLAELGWKPADGQRLRMDWGALATGPDGNEVLRRVYWANKATGIVSDAPSEAILQPKQWGYLLVHDRKRPSAEDQFKEETIAVEKPHKEVKDDVDDILESLGEEK